MMEKRIWVQGWIMTVAAAAPLWAAEPAKPFQSGQIVGDKLVTQPGSRIAESKTLTQAFFSAMNRSETIGEQVELIDQAEERYQQAKGGLFPSVNFTASYAKQEAPSANLNRSFSPSSQPLVRISANQPLFRGLREFAALRQAGTLTDAQRLASQEATRLLYVDVAQSHYNVLSLEQDLRNLRGEIELNQERLVDLRKRVQIGRSRLAEVLTVESSIATLQAQVDQVSGQIRIARDAFSFLTGLPSSVTLQDEIPNRIQIMKLDDYLGRIENRPDVLSAAARLDATEESVKIAKGAHLPSVDLSGNYYLLRSGINEDVSWDAQIALTLPIFAGGTIQSQVRQAASVSRQNDLVLSRTRRAADREIRTHFESLRSNMAQVEDLQKVVELWERNYKETRRDYGLGLVTNLEVLSVLTNYQSSRRSLDRAKYLAKVDLIRLETAAALRPGK